MTNELLPCPFCGGSPGQDYQQGYRTLSGGRLDHAATIYCTGCNVNMMICREDTPELSDEDRMAIMIENWNRRATPPETNVRVDYHELLMRLQAVQHATDRPYAASVAKDAGDAIKALLASQPPSPQAQPFAWYWHDQHGCLYITGDDRKPDVPAGAKPLYEHAPQEQTTGLPQDVINLVIAAREFWDGNNDLSHESRALDKALTAFSERVPYENQPDEDENNG